MSIIYTKNQDGSIKKVEQVESIVNIKALNKLIVSLDDQIKENQKQKSIIQAQIDEIINQIPDVASEVAAISEDLQK